MVMQRDCPAGHAGGWQIPRTQLSPAAHAFPQPPQFETLVCVLTHIMEGAVGAQSTSPIGHIRSATQRPAAQRCPIAQAFPHIPQCVASVWVSTQPPPHAV